MRCMNKLLNHKQRYAKHAHSFLRNDSRLILVCALLAASGLVARYLVLNNLI